jgi:hypothetical protein
MSITDCKSKTKTVGRGAAGASTLQAILRRWHVTSAGIRKALGGIRDPRLRVDIQRVIDAYWTGKAPEPTALPEERAQALATVCDALLRQFDTDQAVAAEIRMVVHKRHELRAEPASGLRSDAGSTDDVNDQELVWELRRLLASSGGAIGDVAYALERRGGDVDRKGHELLEEEVRAIEVDLAVLKTFLSDPVDWDGECRRLLSDEVPPFDDWPAEDDQDDGD